MWVFIVLGKMKDYQNISQRVQGIDSFKKAYDSLRR
jgi:hypothetical protein